MKTIRDWLHEYQQSHMNPTNKALHWVCVPWIVFSLFCALLAVPIGTVWVNAATVTAALALAYYLRLSWRLALGAIPAFLAMYAGALALQGVAGGALLWVAAGIFVLAWIGQFVGHHVEGARPSFLKDLQFLMIGPLWLLADVYRRLGLPIEAAEVAPAH
jgi:uncharacterized membrane protein YGL010W